MNAAKMTLDTIRTPSGGPLPAAPRTGLLARLRRLLRRPARTAASRLPPGRMVVEARRMVWDDLPVGRDIVCEHGALWLTFDHLGQDIVLEPGQAHHCTQSTRLGVYALQRSVLRIS